MKTEMNRVLVDLMVSAVILWTGTTQLLGLKPSATSASSRITLATISLYRVQWTEPEKWREERRQLRV